MFLSEGFFKFNLNKYKHDLLNFFENDCPYVYFWKNGKKLH